mmetsp:Transcript_47163/g.131660  ORF Transcript_47163/g.131660 Transcript_47163/m.131660 type:complete len:177 (-) Transcript_47163:112-642(-)
MGSAALVNHGTSFDGSQASAERLASTVMACTRTVVLLTAFAAAFRVTLFCCPRGLRKARIAGRSRESANGQNTAVAAEGVNFFGRMVDALEEMRATREAVTRDLKSLWLVCCHGAGVSLPPMAIEHIASFLDAGWATARTGSVSKRSGDGDARIIDTAAAVNGIRARALGGAGSTC